MRLLVPCPPEKVPMSLHKPGDYRAVQRLNGAPKQAVTGLTAVVLASIVSCPAFGQSYTISTFAGGGLPVKFRERQPASAVC